MKATINAEQVRRIASLAHLALADDEVELFSRQLSDMLAHFEALEELDTDEVEPTSLAVPMHCPVRPDEVRPSLGSDVLLQRAPARAHDLFEVPKVID